MSLRERLTVIITTSPIRSHPSTEMISQVRASFALIEVLPRPHVVTSIRFLHSHTHWQGLIDCPQIIIADGVSIVEKSALKKGKVTASLSARYSQYLQLLGDALEAEAAQFQVQVSPLLLAFDSP